MTEQRNPYFGRPPRPYLRISFSDSGGTVHELTLLADTGSPFAVILQPEWFERLVEIQTKRVESNFGKMATGWLHIVMPEFGIFELVKGYSSRNAGELLRDENPLLDGLVGLPVLRLGEYGGNARDFWFRYPTPNPLSP